MVNLREPFFFYLLNSQFKYTSFNYLINSQIKFKVFYYLIDNQILAHHF